jgi:hypothetical protein
LLSNSDPEHATLTITRNRPNDIQQRQVYISLDGEKLGFLLYGDSLTHELSAGPHVLKANNTLFWKSVAFDAGRGEHVQFVINNYAGKGFFGFLLFFGIAPLYLSIERIGK